MATDETTEETEGPVKEKQSMDDQSKKIKQAGVEETPAGQVLSEEETAPEPKAKTPDELKQNPHDALDINETAVDPLSVDYPANGEMLESMKNPNADGDTIIKKDGQGVKNGGGYWEDSPPAIEDKVKGKQGLSKHVDLETYRRMKAPSVGEEVYSEEAYHGHVITVLELANHFEVTIDGDQVRKQFNSGAAARAEGRRICDSGEYMYL